LGILAACYKTEISSIDVESQTMDRFGPLVREEDYSETTNMGTGMRCIFLYSGIHLDIISSGEFIAPFLSLTFLASILILFDSFLIYLTFLPPFPVVISNSFISLDVDHQIWTSIWTPRSSPDYDPILQAAKKLADILRAKKAYMNTAISYLGCECEVSESGIDSSFESETETERWRRVRMGVDDLLILMLTQSSSDASNTAIKPRLQR